MGSIAGTGIPTETRLTCPRCKFLHFLVSIDGGVTQFCDACEWRFLLGTPTIATPAVPASTVTATNNSGTVVAVTITGGTLTFVFVNAVQVGTTAGTYLVPVAGTISITYSVAPTWAWALPQISAGTAIGATALTVASGGAYFTAGMQLLVDTAGNAEGCQVAAGATATSIPLMGFSGAGTGLAKAHVINTVFGNVVLTPAFNAAGETAVPAAPGWGF